jgi:hypothetical protein
MIRASVALTLLLLAAGCGDNEQPRLPVISDLGGPRMAHPQLVLLFYGDDAQAGELTTYSQWLVASSWLDQVGAEYGVGTGSILAVAQRTEPAPQQLDNTAIVDMLFQGIADGSLPQPPADGPGDVLYVVNVPQPTVVTFSGSTSCTDFGGYHASARRNGVELAYALVATCPELVFGLTELEIREFVLSHELIEAATDPVPSNHPAFQLRDPSGGWSALGGEVADLCTRFDSTGIWREDRFVAQRSWSNAAAALGDPCVPDPTGEVYFNVKRDGNVMPRIPPGAHATVSITGWATGSTTDWDLSTATQRPSDVMLAPQMRRLGAGKSTKIDIDLSASAVPGTILDIFVYSRLSAERYQVLPMTAVVGEPCSTFAFCDDCSSRIGCGYCKDTDRCLPDGIGGSADGSCSGSSFAHWPGSCPGFCARYSGSCAECASQPGCGWCGSGDSGQCLEANDNFAGPATATCAYADWAFTPEYCSPSSQAARSPRR